MFRTLAFVAMLLVVQVPPSTAREARPARAKSEREARAKAELNRIRSLIGAAKYKTAKRRLRKLIDAYPGTLAALQALIILDTIEDYPGR
jgi:hypothetical protein